MASTVVANSWLDEVERALEPNRTWRYTDCDKLIRYAHIDEVCKLAVAQAEAADNDGIELLRSAGWTEEECAEFLWRLSPNKDYSPDSTRETVPVAA